MSLIVGAILGTGSANEVTHSDIIRWQPVLTRTFFFFVPCKYQKSLFHRPLTLTSEPNVTNSRFGRSLQPVPFSCTTAAKKPRNEKVLIIDPKLGPGEYYVDTEFFNP